MATLSLQIAAGSDDGYCDTFNGFVRSTQTTMRVGGAGAGYSPFLRFTGVQIEQGQQVDSAVLTLSMISPGGLSNATQRIYAVLNANATVSMLNPDDWPGVSLTSAFVDWDIQSVTQGPNQLPDVASVAQEVIDLPDWQSGNAVVFVLLPIGGSGSFLTCDTYEGNPANAAKLAVAYPGASIPPQTVEPELLTGTLSLYSPTVNVSGAASATPTLLTSIPTFPTPSLRASAVRLSPSRLTGSPTLNSPALSPSGSVPVSPALLTGKPTFAVPTLHATAHLSPTLLTGTPTFPVPTLHATAHLALTRLTSAPAFHIPAISGAGSVTLTPALLTGAGALYTPLLNPGKPVQIYGVTFTVQGLGMTWQLGDLIVAMDANTINVTWKPGGSGA